VNPLPLPVRLTLVSAVTVAVGGVIATERLDARGRLFPHAPASMQIEQSTKVTYTRMAAPFGEC